MDAALRRLGQIADADRGALAVQRELVQVNDVVRAVLPLARAAAERRGALVEAELEPGLPRVWADRARLAEALTPLLDAAAGTSGPDRPVTVSTARSAASAVVTIAPRGDVGATPEAGGQAGIVLAARLIEAQAGRLESEPDAVRLHFD
jgi:signal transduction histidine kinase